MNEESVEELRAAAWAAQTKLRKVEDRQRVESHQGTVGKCFRYRNSYGSEEDWWLYAKANRITDDGHLEVHEFQTTPRGEIKIEFGRKHYFRMSEGYQEIDVDQFDDAWREVVGRINDFVYLPPPK